MPKRQGKLSMHMHMLPTLLYNNDKTGEGISN